MPRGNAGWLRRTIDSVWERPTAGGRTIGSGIWPRRAGRRVRPRPATRASRGRQPARALARGHGDRPEDPAAQDGAPPPLALSARRRTPREIPGASLLIPGQRPVPQHLGEPEPLRLPSVQDPLHDVGRQASERQEPADIRIRHAFLLRKIGDRPRLAALDPAAPPVRTHERFDQGLVRARLSCRCCHALWRHDQLSAAPPLQPDRDDGIATLRSGLFDHERVRDLFCLRRRPELSRAFASSRSRSSSPGSLGMGIQY